MTRRTECALIVSIIVLATFARTWRLTTMPGGLFPDQAANGEDALAILQGDIRPFYEGGNGREALFFYLQAALLALFGIRVWPMFLASALVGIATVAATYAAGRRLFGVSAGLISAVFIATNPWHVTISRAGFRAILIPLFITFTIFFLLGIARARSARQRFLEAFGAGTAFGLGWYTYIAYRVFPAVLLLTGVFWFIADCTRPPRWLAVRRLARSLALTFVTAFFTTLPLLLYFMNHQGSFIGRASHVSVFNPDLNKGHIVKTVGNVFGHSVLAFFTAGDRNPRHNVPGVPFLSPLVALSFVIGSGIIIVRCGRYLRDIFRFARRPQGLSAILVLLLLIFMIAPAVATAEGIPHGLRSIGEIPAVFWIAGLGSSWFVTAVRRRTSGRSRMLSTVAIGLLLAIAVLYDLSLYFVVAARSPTFWYEYRSDLTVVSQRLLARARTGQKPPYLVLDNFSAQTVHFLTTEARYPYTLVRPEDSHEILLDYADEIIFTQSTLPDADRYANRHSEAQEIDRRTDERGTVIMRVYAFSGTQ